MRYLIRHVKSMRCLFFHVKCMRYLICHVKCMRILFHHVKCMRFSFQKIASKMFSAHWFKFSKLSKGKEKSSKYICCKKNPQDKNSKWQKRFGWTLHTQTVTEMFKNLSASSVDSLWAEDRNAPIRERHFNCLFPERSAYAEFLLGDWPINFIFLDPFDPKYF